MAKKEAAPAKKESVTKEMVAQMASKKGWRMTESGKMRKKAC